MKKEMSPICHERQMCSRNRSFSGNDGKNLGTSLEEMSTKGLEWKENVVISSMCTVFAESEVVSLVAQNKEVADIIHGLNVSVASK